MAVGEYLERRLALAVDVTLSGSTLSVAYGAIGDAATLAIDGDLNYTVTGVDGTIVTGSAATGSFDSVFAVVVVNESEGGGQSFTLSGAEFVQVLAGLTVGSQTAGISSVTITAPEFFGAMGPVAIYADDVTIPTTVYGPGQSLVIVATDAVAIDSIDDFGGSISITCTSLSMSGSLLNDWGFESGPASDSLTGGTGYSIAITATDTIAIAGAVSSNGGSCIIEVGGAGTVAAGNGGTISLVAGGSITVSGGVSAVGGSVTTQGGFAAEAVAGAGGSISVTSGGIVTVGGMTVAGGSAAAGTGTTTTGGAAGTIVVTAADGIAVSGSINAAGGTGATSNGVNGSIEMAIEPAATASVMVRTSRRTAPFIRTNSIVGAEIRLHGAAGVIQLQGDITAGRGRLTPGSILLDSAVALQRGIRLDTAAAGSGSFVIVTGTIDGPHPLVVAAGSGAVRFEGVIGGVRPLAGVRFESAGSVVAQQRIRLNGAARSPLRHGIEIAPGVNNVNLSQGGEIVNFRAGQAIHAPGNTRGSVIRGFRIANSGQFFFGAGDSSGTTIAANFTTQTVFRKSTATIGMTVGSSGGGIQLSGQARSGDTVTVYVDGTPLGATVAAHGRWTIVAAPLAAGRQSLQVRALSTAGVAAGFSRPVTIVARPVGPPS